MGAGDVRAFLERNSLLARRDLGQNFLWDESLAAKLVELAGVRPEDSVLEIGTGLGILTRALAARARRVVSLEVDAGLVEALRREKQLPANVELVHIDAMRADLPALLAGCGAPARLVANLPYSVSGPLLRRILDLRDGLVDWSVMLQREVAMRLLASSGTRAYGSLTVLHRLCVDIGRELELSPGSFHPAPRVRSVFLRLRPLSPPLLAADELTRVERVVRAAFGQRRKMLSNALRAGLDPSPEPELLGRVLDALGIDRRARAESLEPVALLELARALPAAGPLVS